MATIQEIRKQYPQYNDMPDADLAKALHDKFYSDMPFDEFSKRIGLTAAPQTNEQPPAMGVAKSAGTAVVQGLADIPGAFGTSGQMTQDMVSGGAKWLGVPDDIAGYAGKAARWMGGPLMNMPTSEQTVGIVEKATGPLYQPKTPTEKMVNSGIRFGVSSLVGPGSIGMRVGSGVVAGLGSEAAGQAFEGSSVEPAARIGGALLGGLAPEAIRTGWGAVVQAMRPPNEKAAQVLVQRLQDSGLTPDQALQKVQEMGPDAMLADISPGMQVATGGAAVADPGAGQMIASRLGDRRERAPTRVNDILDNAFGPYKGPQTISDEISTARQPAGPAYELAKTHVVDPENALAKIDDLLKTFGTNSDIGKSLLGFKSQLIDGAGNVIGEGNKVHGVREQLDDAISAAYAANQGKMAGRLREVRDEIDNALKTQIPGFADADKIWSDTAKIGNAYEYGQTQLLGKGVHPDQSAKKLDKMAGPEKVATQQGVRAKLAMDFSNPSRNPALPVERTLLGNMNDQKVPQLIGDDRFKELNRGLGAETTYLETSGLGEPSRGSRTAVLEAAKDMFGASGSRSLLGDTVSGAAAGGLLGGPAGIAAGAGAGFLTSAKDRVADALRTKSQPAVVQAAAAMLTATKGDVFAAVQQLNAVAAKMPRGSVKEGAIRALANALLSLKSSVPASAQSH